jgi:protein gp37
MKLGNFEVHPVAAAFPQLPPEEFMALVKDIEQKGLREPIVLAPDDKTIVDGCNRYRACIKADRKPSFKTLSSKYGEEEILNYIISANLYRRHLNAGQRALIGQDALIPALTKLAKERQRLSPGRGKGKGVPDLAHLNGEPRVREQVAKMVGVSNGTMSKAAVVTANPDLKAKVISGEESIDEAAKQGRKRAAAHSEPKVETSKETITLLTHEGDRIEYPLPKTKPHFNPTNEFIGWAAWSWNPVTGCLHNCPYCYARELALRDSFHANYPVGFTPLFHNERLSSPANTEVPADAKQYPTKGRVFVCSMADLYGRWVPQEWITAVHQACKDNRQWEYLMLTKFPQRYLECDDLPPTAWLGTSVDEQKRVRIAEDAFRQIKGVRVKWLSLEPLLAPLKFTDLSMFDWIVIGSQTQTVQPNGVVEAFAPPFEWVAKLVAQAREAGCKVFLKQNLLGRTDEQAPGMTLPQEAPKGSR